MKNDAKSVLNLDKLVFNRMEFKRLGMKNENEPEFKMQVRIDKKQSEDIYKVTLDLNVNKEKEYTLEIELSGYFSFNTAETLDEEKKKNMICRNAVAIIMPYMRSQVSLMTAQPEMDCIVLPPFNIIAMLEQEE